MLLSRLLGDAVVAGHTEVALLITTRAFGYDPLRLTQSNPRYNSQFNFRFIYSIITLMEGSVYPIYR